MISRALALIVSLAAGAIALAGSANAQTADEDDRVLQLRIYEIFEENKQAFHERFRDHAARIMARHDFEIVAMWEAKSDARTEFVYILSWPDEKTMKEAWTAFMADEEWSEIKQRTGAEHGVLVGDIEERIMRFTDYSPVLSLPG